MENGFDYCCNKEMDECCCCCCCLGLNGIVERIVVEMDDFVFE